jgi:hypothetical protein
METNATTSVTRPAVAQRATTIRDDLGRFTSFSAPPVFSSSSSDQFQVDPFQVDPFQVDPFQVDPFHVEPFQVDPFHVEPFHVEPFQVDPFHVEPFHVDPFHVDPFHVDPFQVDPFQVNPFQVDPFQVEPVQLPGFHDDTAPAASMLTVCPICVTTVGTDWFKVIGAEPTAAAALRMP